MRILAVLHRSEIGGTEVCYGRLLSVLAHREDVQLLGLYPGGPLVAQWAGLAPWAPYGAGALPIGCGKREYFDWLCDGLQHSGDVASAIDHFRPDVVLCLTSVLTAPVAVAGRLGVPCVSYVREYIEPRAVRVALWRYLGRKCDALIAVSAPLAHDVEPYARGRTFLVRDGVPVPALPGGAVGGSREVAFFGGYESLKGGDVFVESAPAVAARIGDARFRYYGEAWPSQEWFREVVVDRAAALGAPIDFVYTRSFSEGQCSAGVVVMPSRKEGLGLVALESMACGVPVVASRVGGLPDVVKDGETGLLVTPENPAALADAISVLLSDEAGRARMGRAARADVMSRFSIDSAAKGLLDVLQRVVENRRGGVG